MNKQDNLCKALCILPTDLSTQINGKNPWVLHLVNGLPASTYQVLEGGEVASIVEVTKKNTL